MQSSASAGVQLVAKPSVAIALLSHGPCAGGGPAVVLLSHLGDAGSGEINPPPWRWPGNVSLVSHIVPVGLVRRCEPPPVKVLPLRLRCLGVASV